MVRAGCSARGGSGGGVTEVVITSAVVVRPGDKVLLVVPGEYNYTPQDLDLLSSYVKSWAPDADWLVVGGVEVIHKPAEVPGD